MKARALAAAVCLAVLGTFAFAGGAQEPAGGGTPAEKVTITFSTWEQEIHVKMWEKAINEILAREHPRISMKPMIIPWAEYNIKVPAMIAAGTPPDVMLMLYPFAKQYADIDAVAPLDPFLAKDETLKLSDFTETSVQGYSIDGEQIALPVINTAWLLYYNQDLFDKAGLSYPDESWSWEGKFLDAAKKLNQDVNGDGKTDIFGYTQNLWFNRCHNIILEYGGNYFSDDGTKCIMDQPESVTALSFLYDLLHKHKVMPTPDQLMGQSFQAFFSAERAATFMSGFFYFRAVMDNTKARWAVAPIPQGPKGRFQIEASNGISVVRSSQHQAEAWEVLKAFFHEDAVKAAMDFQYHTSYFKSVLQPGSELNRYFFEVTELDPKGAQFLLDTLKYSVALPPIANGGEVMRVQAEKLWQPMWQPGQNVPELARNTTIALDKVLSGQ
ncbi:MAG: sugar ABC transporter substrate-binding protein [Spirochaetales bacterium]|nr:sugar ABC transporter substrate-binding protein [Spirochaetales bacterium]